MSTATTSAPKQHTRSLLVFGLAPTDNPSSPWPPARLSATLSSQQTLATERNWILAVHTLDPAQPVAAIMEAATEALRSRDRWDVVSVGFGLRGNPRLTPWFELLVNLIVREALVSGHGGGGRDLDETKMTKLGFATSPDRLVQDAEALVEREEGEGKV